MMGPEYFTTGAYINDGSLLCPQCGDNEGLPVSDQITEAQLFESFGSETGGVYCDRCSEVLIEPDDEVEVEEDLGEEEDSADFENEA